MRDVKGIQLAMHDDLPPDLPTREYAAQRIPDLCPDEHGSDAAPAVVAYIERGGLLLSVSRKDSGLAAAPGGKLEPGESLRSGLEREVREEAGVEVVAAREVYRGLHKSGRVVVAFRCMIVGEPVAVEEGTVVEWVPPRSLAEGFAPEYHRQALVAAGFGSDLQQQACTSFTARWCPQCGTCQCDFDKPTGWAEEWGKACPLHGETSTHALAAPQVSGIHVDIEERLVRAYLHVVMGPSTPTGHRGIRGGIRGVIAELGKMGREALPMPSDEELAAEAARHAFDKRWWDGEASESEREAFVQDARDVLSRDQNADVDPDFRREVSAYVAGARRKGRPDGAADPSLAIIVAKDAEISAANASNAALCTVLSQVMIALGLANGERLVEPVNHAAVSAAVALADERNAALAEVETLRKRVAILEIAPKAAAYANAIEGSMADEDDAERAAQVIERGFGDGAWDRSVLEYVQRLVDNDKSNPLRKVAIDKAKP